MKPQFCLGFQVHHPLSFAPDAHQFESDLHVFSHMAQEVYLPFFSWYNQLLIKESSVRGFLSLSGIFLDYCEADPMLGAETLNQCKRLVSTHRIELPTEAYHHMVPFLYDHKSFLKQVLKHHDALHDHFGVRSRTARFVRKKGWEERAALLQYLGFAYGIVESQKTQHYSLPIHPLSEIDKELIMQYAPLNTKGDIHVSEKSLEMYTAERRVKKIIMEGLLGRKNPEFIADDIVDHLYEHEEPLFIILDIEECLQVNSVEWGIEYLERFTKRLIERNVEFKQPSEYQDVPLGVPTGLEHIDHQYIMNPDMIVNDLQQSAWDELQLALEAIEKQDWTETLQWLQHPDHFHAMVTINGSPHDSVYQAFESYVQGVRKLREDQEDEEV